MLKASCQMIANAANVESLDKAKAVARHGDVAQYVLDAAKKVPLSAGLKQSHRLMSLCVPMDRPLADVFSERRPM
jgi:hypothetical protein